MVVIFGLLPGDDVDLPFVSRRFSVVLQRKRNSSFPHFPTSLAQSKNFSHNSRTLLLHTVGDCCWFNYQITWYIYIFADLFLGIFFMGKTCPIHATFHCQMRPSCQTPTQSGLQLAGRAGDRHRFFILVLRVNVAAPAMGDMTRLVYSCFDIILFIY